VGEILCAGMRAVFDLRSNDLALFPYIAVAESDIYSLFWGLFGGEWFTKSGVRTFENPGSRIL
jgi:hypothetical protein